MIDSNALFPLAIVLLLLTLIIGLKRALHGPSLHDRVLSVQLMSTVGVALLLLLASFTDVVAFVDVALVLALLAAVAAAALTRREVKDD